MSTTTTDARAATTCPAAPTADAPACGGQNGRWVREAECCTVDFAKVPDGAAWASFTCDDASGPCRDAAPALFAVGGRLESAVRTGAPPATSFDCVCCDCGGHGSCGAAGCVCDPGFAGSKCQNQYVYRSTAWRRA